MSQGVVGILVDAENLSAWGEGALAMLLERARREGEVTVRRAYADWTSGAGPLVPALSRHGFELVQVHHPVARKNSADIQMTVDAMDLLALEPDLRTFVLATGDSDFAPLFRRLRERRCRVIGAGPRSPLSQAVVSSCVDYLYLGHPLQAPRRAVRILPGRTTSAPAPAPATSRPGSAVVRRPTVAPHAPAAAAPAAPAGPASPAARAAPPSPVPTAPAPPSAAPPSPAATEPGPPSWPSLLKKWGWHRLTAEQLDQAYAAMLDRGAAARADHVTHAVDLLGEGWATTFRHAYALFMKCGVLERVPGDDAVYTVRPV